MDDRLESLERDSARRALDREATDRGLAASVSGLAEMVAQVRDQQERIVAQQDFLLTRTQYDARPLSNLTETDLPGTNDQLEYRPYDPDHDVTVEGETSGSGLLEVDFSGRVAVAPNVQAGWYIAIYQNGVALPASALYFALMGGGSVGLATTIGRRFQVALTPRTHFRVVALRGYSASSASGALAAASWRYPAMSVSKIGM